MEIIVREVAVRGERHQTGSLVGKFRQHSGRSVTKMHKWGIMKADFILTRECLLLERGMPRETLDSDLG